MNEDIRKLKWLIEEYEDLCNEAEEMREDWENGSECAAAMSNPRDQYMKGMEIEEKYNEIKGVLNAL
jgi:hypothetical protein